MKLISKKSPIKKSINASEIESLLTSSQNLVKNEAFVKAGICSIENTSCFVKKYIGRGFIYTLKNFFRESKAEKNFRISEYLCESEVYFPHVYAVAKEGSLFSGYTIYLIMEVINEIGDDDFYKDVVYAEKENLHYYILKAAEQLNCLHKVNFYHGDAKRSNFFIDGIAESYRAGVLDFDGSKIYKNLPLAKRARDLGRFTASVLEDQKRHAKDFYKMQEVIDIIFSVYLCNINKELLIKKVIRDAKYHLRRKNIR